MVTDIELMPRGSICSSPHYSIKFKVKLACKRLKAAKRKIYNLKKADFKSLNDELSRLPWDDIISDNVDIDKSLNNFELTFSAVCDRHIPKVTVNSSIQPPWFDCELDAICKKKNKLLTKYRKAVDPAIKSKINDEIKKDRKNIGRLVIKKRWTTL